MRYPLANRKGREDPGAGLRATMTQHEHDILIDDPALIQRIDRLAVRTRRRREDIVRDALEQGRSLAWQERWVAGVEEGLADADRGAFAAPAEVARVLRKRDDDA